MPIYELNLENLGPFDDIHFEFNPKINVFIGPNNSGKSTVLMALGDITVYPFALPDKLLKEKKSTFQVVEGANSSTKRINKGEFPISLGTPYWTKSKYNPLEKSLKKLGFTYFIPALRWSTDYRAKSPIITKEKEEEQYIVLPSRKLVRRIPEQRTNELARRESFFEPKAAGVRDEALIQKMINLDYRAYREKRPTIRKIVEKIASIASEITDGFPIEFLGIAEDKDGLYPEFKTPNGNLPINVLSQGTQSIIQYLGLLLIGYAEYSNFAKNFDKKPGVVFIDEIDAHMHPSWQRRILPALSSHFPKLQIFCSSHSPLAIAGLKAGQAQLLKRDRKGKVVVSRNETDIVGWSTDEILRNFLDIANPTDLQTHDNIERLQKLRRKKKLCKKEKNELDNLRNTVNQNLISGAISSEMNQLVQIMQKASSGSPPHKKSKVLKKTKKSKVRRRDI